MDTLKKVRSGIRTAVFVVDNVRFEGSVKAGMTAMSNGEFSEAVRHFSEALQHDANILGEDGPCLLCNRSAAFFRLNQFKDSLDDAIKAVRLCKTYARAHYRKALALRQLGEIVHAKAAAQECLNIDPVYPSAGELLKELSGIRNTVAGANCSPVISSPLKAPEPSLPTISYVGFVVDGYCFTLTYGWEHSVFDLLLRESIATIQAKTPQAKVAVHPKAMVIMFPNPLDAEAKGLTPLETARDTIKRLQGLSRLGWRTVHTDFKKVGDRWMASAEDVAFSNETAMLCGHEKLPPLGADPAPVTLTHMVLVTGDKDHLSTLRAQSNRELRWLISPVKNDTMEQEARMLQRLIRFSAPPQPRPASFPSPEQPTAAGIGRPASAAAPRQDAVGKVMEIVGCDAVAAAEAIASVERSGVPSYEITKWAVECLLTKKPPSSWAFRVVFHNVLGEQLRCSRGNTTLVLQSTSNGWADVLRNGTSLRVCCTSPCRMLLEGGGAEGNGTEPPTVFGNWTLTVCRDRVQISNRCTPSTSRFTLGLTNIEVRV